VSKGRLEAFSDGVLAIIITIMILELHVPQGTTLDDLFAVWPQFLAYTMSFGYLAIYWNNHHHLLQAAKTVSGWVLWANMLLLFTLSLVPFATAWMGEHSFAPVPVAVYNAALILPAVSFTLLVITLMRAPGQSATLTETLEGDKKGMLSIALYLIALGTSLFAPFAAVAIDLVVSAMWVIPSQRIERRLSEPQSERQH
jgi:uncharacterized membrane protein